MEVKQSTAEIGVSFEDVVSSAYTDFTNEFRGIQEPSQEVLKSLVILNKNFGISTSEKSKVNGIFQDISGLSQEALVQQILDCSKINWSIAPS